MGAAAIMQGPYIVAYIPMGAAYIPMGAAVIMQGAYIAAYIPMGAAYIPMGAAVIMLLTFPWVPL